MFSSRPVIPTESDAFFLTLNPRGSDRDLARSLTSVSRPAVRDAEARPSRQEDSAIGRDER
jgi:hypothetical protein